MWKTVGLDREYVDDENESGLGEGTVIKVTLFFDCFCGEDEQSAELKEVSFARIVASDGQQIYSRLGCNVIKLDSFDWNGLYSFVTKRVRRSWSEIEPKALAADPVRHSSEDY